MERFNRKRYILCLQYIVRCIATVLFLNFPLTAKQIPETTIIKSNKINKKDADIIKAIGNVEIKRGSNILNANEVEYNQTTKTITSNSDVKLYDEKYENIFFSEKAVMNDDLSNADFYNGILLFKNGSNISSPHMNRINEDIITMSKANYSVCPTDLYNKDITYEQITRELSKQKTPLFSLKSHKATANTENKTIKLVGTSFWIWKIPFFFIPYINTPYSTEEKMSGFGMPSLEKTSYYGYAVDIPYKIKTQRQIFKITPKIYEKGNFLVNLKYNVFSDPINDNNKKNKWNFNFQGDITNDNGQSKTLKNAYGITEENEGNYKKWRGYASVQGFYNVDDLWKIDYNSKIVSDRYYLRDYYGDSSEYIQSFINLTRTNLNDIYDFNYFQFINLFYQELLEPIDANNPRYAPISNLNIQNYIFKNANSNLLYKIKTNTTNLFRRKGIEYNRFSLTPSFQYMLKNDNIGIVNADIQFRGDVYLLNEVNTDQKLYRNNESRMFPQLNIEWKKSFIFNNFLFQPIIKYSGSPNSQNFENKIPNEDSKADVISFENIFSNNRFSGYDRQEFGNRITYGFESILFNNINIGIAQGYRDNLKKNTNENYLIGFTENLSDYVGYISYILNNNVDFYYRFLVDKDDFKIKKDELTTNLNFKYFNLYLTYTNIKSSLFNAEKQQQINSGILFNIFDKWKLDLSGIMDLQHNNRLLESRIGLLYDGGCTKWEISYSNSNPLTETEKNTSINFNFIIKFL